MKANTPGWPKNSTVQIKIYDETDAETDLDWTTVGVVEIPITDDYSEYKYDVDVEEGHDVSVYFRTVEDDPYFCSVTLRRDSAAIIYPVIEGSVYTTSACDETTLRIKRGDTPTITFDFNESYSGWTPYFGARKTETSATYAITPRACTWTSAVDGTGYITLTSTETNLIGEYIGEIELRNGTNRLTAMTLSLVFSRDIITT